MSDKIADNHLCNGLAVCYAALSSLVKVGLVPDAPSSLWGSSTAVELAVNLTVLNISVICFVNASATALSTSDRPSGSCTSFCGWTVTWDLEADAPVVLWISAEPVDWIPSCAAEHCNRLIGWYTIGAGELVQEAYWLMYCFCSWIVAREWMSDTRLVLLNLCETLKCQTCHLCCWTCVRP